MIIEGMPIKCEVYQVRLEPGIYAVGDPVFLEGIDLSADDVFLCFSLMGDGHLRDARGNIYTMETRRLAIAPANSVKVTENELAHLVELKAMTDVRCYMLSQVIVPINDDLNYVSEAGFIIYYEVPAD